MREEGSPTLFDADEGERRRDEGCANALSKRDVWRADALAWVAGLRMGTTFTADDLVEAVGLPTLQGFHERPNNAVGGFMRSLNAGDLRYARPTKQYRKSTRVTNHGRVLAVWIRT